MKRNEMGVKLPDNLITPRTPTLFEDIDLLKNKLILEFMDLKLRATLKDQLSLLSRVHEEELCKLVQDKFNSDIDIKGEIIYETDESYNRVDIYIGVHLKKGIKIKGSHATKTYYEKEYAII